MKLEHSFEVRAPLERVWEALVDVERVAPCLPGAEITEAGDDGSYRGNFTVKLGPTTASYRGELAMEEVDEQAHRAVMRASGSDKRGQGSAKATIVNVMRQEGELTTVEVETEFTITGRLARFGRGGMIQDVSNRLLRDFSECLQHTIESAEPAAEAASEPTPGETPAESAQTAPAATQAARPAPRQAKPVGGLSLLFRVLVDRLKRLFGRG
jgi:carbon monoxide dehydrogenase subunit G